MPVNVKCERVDMSVNLSCVYKSDLSVCDSFSLLCLDKFTFMCLFLMTFTHDRFIYIKKCNFLSLLRFFVQEVYVL